MTVAVTPCFADCAARALRAPLFAVSFMGLLCWPLLLEAAAYFGMAACGLLIAFHASSASAAPRPEMALTARWQYGLIYRLAAGFAATAGIAATLLALLS